MATGDQRHALVVEEQGQGSAALVMIHGLGGSANSFAPQAAVMKRDCRMIIPDLAGSGRSPLADEISIESHAADILGLMAERGLTRVHLVGHSMGTIVCQHVAAQAPDKVASLVLMGAFQAPPEAARAALRDRARKARTEGMRGIADAIVAAGTSDDTKVNQPAAAAFVRESLMAQDPEGYARNCEALAAARPADLGRIGVRVLLLTGDQDRTAPPDVARAIASELADAECVILPGCGHWTPIERAKQVSYAMARHFALLRNAARAAA